MCRKEDRPAGNGAVSGAAHSDTSVGGTTDKRCGQCSTLDLVDLATCTRFGITCGPETCAKELIEVTR